eukprot:8427100-Prorocentrum_lima.AAC.1
MTIIMFQFRTKKTICTTVRQHPCKKYSQCNVMTTSTTAHLHRKYRQHYGSLTVQLIVGAL